MPASRVSTSKFSSTATSLSSSRLKCPLCIKDFTVPRCLPCLHSFCQDCLMRYISKRAAKIKNPSTFECPVCKKVTKAPVNAKQISEWAAFFPQDTIIQSLLPGSKSEIDRPCDPCLTEHNAVQAKGLCVVCNDVLCEECIRSHRKNKASRGHKINLLKDDPDYRHHAKNVSLHMACDTHEDEDAKFFCKDHAIFYCPECEPLAHKSCKNVFDLKKHSARLLKERSPTKASEELENIEAHLLKFTDTSQAHMKQVEFQINNLPYQIRALKKRIDEILDTLERKTKLEGNSLLNEEVKELPDKIKECESLVTAVRNSHRVLDAVVRNDDAVQTFYTIQKIQNHLIFYRKQISGPFSLTDCKELVIYFDATLSALDPDVKVNVETKLEIRRDLDTPRTSLTSARTLSSRQSKEYTLKPEAEFIAKSPNGLGLGPCYTGIAHLSGDRLVLVDYNNKRCCLYDSSFTFVSDHTFTSHPMSVCVVRENTIAVSLQGDPDPAFHIMDVQNAVRSIDTIALSRPIWGLAALSNSKFVVSGVSTDNKYYWGVVSRKGKEKLFHELGDSGGHVITDIALDASKTRVYISLYGTHTVHCCDLEGVEYFRYKNYKDLIRPRGLAVDREGNVYVVGQESNTILQLSNDGTLIHIFRKGVPAKPQQINFNLSGDTLMVTNFSENEKDKCHLLKVS
ncbi:hypothetical protein ACJMK2_038858 [Sinanodonta woodiana]|uniref:Uncharacterized protein n=1 Tax=Sinanodonta woodiana TaxID=1069815 RepID=A0ABD3WDF0_SINWO